MQFKFIFLLARYRFIPWKTPVIVYLDFNTLSRTKSWILTPNRYDNHPLHFYNGSPLPQLWATTLIKMWRYGKEGRDLLQYRGGDSQVKGMGMLIGKLE